MALLDSSGVAALNISFSAANCVINVGPKFGQRNPQHGWISATPFLGFLLFIHTYSRGRSLDGLGVVFQVLMPEDSGSNPEAGSIYSFDEVCPGLGLLQPQWNPYPTLTPPSC